MTEYARPETELLLLCASPPGSEERTERIRQLAGQKLDWDYLLMAATAHALLPLLYWGVKGVRPEAVPTSLEQSFQQNTQNNVHLTRELFQMMSWFASEGIRVLPFKGPTLAAAAFGNLALRRYSDLDLLVRQEDAVRARRVLEANGYKAVPPVSELNPKWEDAYLRAYDEFGMRGPDGQPLVELHWGVTPRYFCVALDIAPYWERATTVNLGGHEIPSLGGEDLLMVLCLHATKHCWSHLSMVSDVAWLMTACQIHWKVVLERARALGALRMVLLSAELSGHLLKVALPKEVVRGVAADPDVQILAADVKMRLLQSPDAEVPRSLLQKILGASWFHLRVRERWLDRMRYVVRLATTVGVEDWEFVNLPASLAFLYPVFRFPRLLWKYRSHP